jgi:hypothetical protein
VKDPQAAALSAYEEEQRAEKGQQRQEHHDERSDIVGDAASVMPTPSRNHLREHPSRSECMPKPRHEIHQACAITIAQPDEGSRARFLRRRVCVDRPRPGHGHKQQSQRCHPANGLQNARSPHVASLFRNRRRPLHGCSLPGFLRRSAEVSVAYLSIYSIPRVGGLVNREPRLRGLKLRAAGRVLPPGGPGRVWNSTCREPGSPRRAAALRLGRFAACVASGWRFAPPVV